MGVAGGFLYDHSVHDVQDKHNENGNQTYGAKNTACIPFISEFAALFPFVDTSHDDTVLKFSKKIAGLISEAKAVAKIAFFLIFGFLTYLAEQNPTVI